MSSKRFIKYTATNSPHYSNAIICDQSNLTDKDDIAQLRRQFQSMMWEQNEIAEKKIRQMKREASAREEKLHRKLTEIQISVDSQRRSPSCRSDEKRRHRKKRCPIHGHHATPMRSAYRTSNRKPATDSDRDRKWSHKIVGKFDVYIVQRSNPAEVDSPVRRILPSAPRSVKFCDEDTSSKESKKRHRRRHKDTEM